MYPRTLAGGVPSPRPPLWGLRFPDPPKKLSSTVEVSRDWAIASISTNQTDHGMARGGSRGLPGSPDVTETPTDGIRGAPRGAPGAPAARAKVLVFGA